MLKAVISGLIIASVLTISPAAQTTTPASGNERKVASRIAPVYPELAKRMHLQGVVKIEAIVRPNGTVKSTRVLGGNPVLVDSAQEAISKWKFEPGPNETTELVQLTFTPQ
ncbi:MAG TPA: energy transducer TonB [Verrucomicrobiae bacterium]|nr:energy transducer TonB [Verrucomicrobiae bacterium]